MEKPPFVLKQQLVEQEVFSRRITKWMFEKNFKANIHKIEHFNEFEHCPLNILVL